MSVWRVKVDLEGGTKYVITLPKTRPDESAADVCRKICQLQYPVFQDSKNKYTVINSEKIIRMGIEEVTE